MAIIPMRAAMSAHPTLLAEGSDLTPEEIGQVVTKGLLGSGVSRIEAASRLRVPFVLDASRYGGVPPWHHQLNQSLMIDETKAMLSRRDARAARVPLDEIQLEFKATRIVSHVIEHIKLVGLHVYTQKLLLDPIRPLKARLALLASMVPNGFPPVSATGAIAAGIMPALPAHSVPDFVRALDSSWLGVTFHVTNRDLKEWVAKSRPYLVEFPLPNLKAGEACRADHFSGKAGFEQLELGLGFFLLEYDKAFDTFRVVSPMLFGSRDNFKPWAPTYQKGYQLMSYGTAFKEAYKQLKELLRVPGRTNVAKLDVCSKCRTIFSADRSDLSHETCTH